jgi:hypothetical protein
MSHMDRRAFVGAAAVGGVAAAVLAASSAVAAGQSGYFVIAEIVSKKDKRMISARSSCPSQNCQPRNRVV